MGNMYILQLTGAIALLANKHLIYKGKEISGWALGLIGLLALLPYNIERQFWVTVVYHISSSVLMAYGLMMKTALGEQISENRKRRAKICLIIFSLLTCTYFCIEVGSPKFVGLQFWQSFTGLIGTLLLVFESPKSKTAGWILYIPSHIFCIAYVAQSNGMTIALFQALSIPYAILGILKELKKITILPFNSPS